MDLLTFGHDVCGKTATIKQCVELLNKQLNTQDELVNKYLEIIKERAEEINTIVDGVFKDGGLK